MYPLLSLLLVIAGIFMIALGVRARLGKMPYNSFFGFRMPYVMKSPEIWEYEHRKYANVFYIIGAVALLCGATFFWGSDFGTQDSLIFLANVALLVEGVVGLVILVAASFFINVDARHMYENSKKKKRK